MIASQLLQLVAGEVRGNARIEPRLSAARF